MKNPRLLRLLLVMFACATITEMRAQATGLNFGMDGRTGSGSDDSGRQFNLAYFLSVQHDFSERVGMGITGAYLSEGLPGFEVIYDAKYFTSNNERTSFFLGSFLGFQRLSTDVYNSATRLTEDVGRTQLPIGLQIGLRGGLPGFFGELHVKAGYNIGNGEFGDGLPNAPSTTPLYLSLGLSYLGFGWEH